MTSTEPLPRADRPLFHPGQLVTADDLTAVQDVDAGLRRLHHRMLHGWGIAQGLAVHGARGATGVTLDPGYALDADGHELVVPEATTVPVPPVAAAPDGGPVTFVLVVRRTGDDEAVVLTRPGPCGAQGAVRRSDAPTVAWLDPGMVRAGTDVVLAEVAVRDCRLAGPSDPALRRLLHPPPTPYVAAGATPAGSTSWQLRTTQGGQPVDVWTEVDTAEAGFGDTPVYLARVAGARLLDAGASPTGEPALLDGAAFVEAPEPGRFRLVVPLVTGTALAGGAALALNPGALLADAGSLAALLRDVLGWHVEWIGLQR